MEDEDGEETPEIPLPNIPDLVMEKVIEFCHYHVNNPMPFIDRPIKSNRIEQIVGQWDAAFIGADVDMILSILMASNFLNIASLCDLSCATIATMLKGKTTEQIREQFHIVNDFTPEEERRVREENKWVDEN